MFVLISKTFFHLYFIFNLAIFSNFLRIYKSTRGDLHEVFKILRKLHIRQVVTHLICYTKHALSLLKKGWRYLRRLRLSQDVKNVLTVLK